MASHLTHLKIFIASPEDVNEERQIIKDVIKDFNVSYSKTFGIYLEAVGWDTNVYPNFGEDAQQVINSQINDDYDIFIGLMWGRFGSPTKREHSGTKEEFIRAYEKYKNNPQSVHVLFYFKDAPISPSKIDLEQLQKIREFQNEIGEKGGLYKVFRSTEEFQSMLKINLPQVVEEYKKTHEPASLKGIQEIKESKVDELGFFEHMDEGVKALEEFYPTVDRLTIYVKELTDKMTQTSREITELNKKPVALREAEGRRIIDQFANAMQNFATRNRLEIPILNDLFGTAIKHLNAAITIYQTFDDGHTDTQIEETKQSLTILHTRLLETVQEVSSFKDLIKTFPGLTTKFTKAKKDVTSMLIDLVTEIYQEIRLLEQLLLAF